MSDETVVMRPKMLAPGDWGRRLHAPFRGYVEDIATRQGGLTPAMDHASFLVRALLNDQPFPRASFRQAVIDCDGWVVYGYSTDPEFIAKWGHPSWWGSEFGFALVESFGVIDPIELAMQEAVARIPVDGEEWWKT